MHGEQLEIPGQFPPCETGNLEHPWPTPLAVGQCDKAGYEGVWMCAECFLVMER